MNSKKKGGKFERKVCKLLSTWVSNGTHQDLFWRSAISGGRATVAHKKGRTVRQAGDICAVTPEGHALTDKWYIECKHVRMLNLDVFFTKGTGQLSKFWKKTLVEAKRHGRDPMIIAQQNGWPTLVLTMKGHVEHWAPPLITGYIQACGYVDITPLARILRKPFNSAGHPR